MNCCFCILGWHFPEPFYRSVYGIPARKFIVSHRPRDEVARLPFVAMIEPDLHFCPNRGMDWGGYHQFNELGLAVDYDFVMFCHDDLVIRDPAFVQAVADRLLDPRVQVVGNGRNGSDHEFRLAKYRHRLILDEPAPEPDDFPVRTVRGSFLAVRRDLFRTIGNFPVCWNTDKKPERANRSLRTFGYLVTKRFGRESIAYLDEHGWLETRYLVELRRGAMPAELTP